MSDTTDEASPVEAPRSRPGFLRRRSWGRWTCRLLSILGIALIILSITGWWLSTRILDDEGFGDVVAKTSQQSAVRDYIADQATLKYAQSSKIVTAARPVVSKAVSEALATPPVTAAIHSFAAGLHRQLLNVNSERRANVSAATASATIRNTLQTIDPALAEKLPDSILDATASISQSSVVDAAAHSTTWVRWLYLPVGIVGVLILLLVFVKAEDPVHAVRFTGFTMAVAGALPIGLGLATPLFAAVGANVDPGRGPAVAGFIKVLLGRLVGAGWVMTVLGLLLAFVPGRDGAGVKTRFERLRAWFGRSRTQPAWQVVGGLLIIAAAAALITVPGELFYWVALVVAAIAVFCALIMILRAIRVLPASRAVRPVRARQVGGVIVAMIAAIALTTSATSAVVAATNPTPRADPKSDGCNGSVEVCLQRLNQVIWYGSHNAMSSSAYDFYGAEHTLSIPDQLNQGVDALLLDVYYGFPESGIVRTNLAGAVDRNQILQEYGKDGLAELDRLGALTGVADTSGSKKQLYFCHDRCELGAIKAVPTLKQIKQYLDRNLTNVLVLDMEDYVEPADLEEALKQAGLWDYVYTVDLSKPLPTLFDMVNPPPGQNDNKRRLVVTSERHAGKAPWLVGSYQLMQETPYTFTAVDQFNCQPNRGAASNPLLLVNHWLRPNGPPDPVQGGKVNSLQTLTDRLEQCIDVRQRLPNVLAVDFVGIGDARKVVDNFNAAVADATGTRAFWDEAVQLTRDDTSLSDKDRADADKLQRLPLVTDQQAQGLLGPLYNKLETPDLVKLDQEVNAETGTTQDPVPSGTPTPSPASAPPS